MHTEVSNHTAALRQTQLLTHLLTKTWPGFATTLSEGRLQFSHIVYLKIPCVCVLPAGRYILYFSSFLWSRAPSQLLCVTLHWSFHGKRLLTITLYFALSLTHPHSLCVSCFPNVCVLSCTMYIHLFLFCRDCPLPQQPWRPYLQERWDQVDQDSWAEGAQWAGDRWDKVIIMCVYIVVLVVSIVQN